MDKKTIVILIGMIIVDSYQRLKDPYRWSTAQPGAFRGLQTETWVILMSFFLCFLLFRGCSPRWVVQ